MIAAIYARKSTSQPGIADEAKSVERQVTNARAFAAARGWVVDDAHIYIDDAVSGAELGKLQSKMRLLTAIRGTARPPFTVLIMQAPDRLSRRDGAEALVELKSIAKRGIDVWFYARGERFTFGDFRSNVTGFLQAEFAAEFRRAIAEKTSEAMIRKARAGHVTGGVTFGYDNHVVSGPDGKRTHVERRINIREADVVRQIFTLAADGLGKTAIAKRLNDRGAPAPRPRSRVPRPVGWAASSVHEVLNRPLYRGVVVFGRTKKRNPDGEHQARPRPADEWIQVSRPELRIVPDALWQAAHARLEQSRRVYLQLTNGERWGKPLNPVSAKYLLTGLAQCGSCGGALEVRRRLHGTGARRRPAYFYMCSTHRRRGAAICRGVRVPMERADDALLSVLERQLLDRGVLQEACRRVLQRPRPGT